MPNCLTPAATDTTARARRDLVPQSTSSDVAPLIWLLQGPRLGDNEQVLALGAALTARFGWPTRIKQMIYKSAAEARVAIDDALDHVDLAASDPISGPESGPRPDLVITIGRRAAPVGRWISTRHPDRAVHIQLGRYQDRFADLDLLVTTAQYGLPPGPNVLQLTLPITTRPVEKLASAAAHFDPLLTGLSRPLIGLLVGGPASPFSFDVDDARRLATEALAFAAARGGTLLVATSPRTPAEVTAALAEMLPKPHCLFPFEKTRRGPNPYLGLLSLCNAFIVTTDSMSMIADAALMGRETRLFPLPMKARRALWQPSWPLQWLGRRRVDRLNQGRPADFLDRCYDGRVRAGYAQPVRYAPVLINRLLRAGQVAWLGDEQVPGTGLASLVAFELEMVLARIESLLAERRARIVTASLAACSVSAQTPPPRRVPALILAEA